MLTILQDAYAQALETALPKMRDYALEIDPEITELLAASNNIADQDELILYYVLAYPDRRVPSPVIAFKKRDRNGDFEPLQPNEDPENLPENREPMDDEAYLRAKNAVLEKARPWKGLNEIAVQDLFRTLLVEATPETGK